MTGGIHDAELADDLVGVASARLLAAGVPRAQRLQALRLLGVLAASADAGSRVRRPLDELAVEFDLPAAEVDGWLAHLIAAGAVHREDRTLVLAGQEPPANGALRLHDFLALADEAAGPARHRPHRLLRPAGAVLAVAAAVLLAVVAPAVVRDRSTPVSTTRGDAPAVATTQPAPGVHPRSSTTVTAPAPAGAVPRAQAGPPRVPSTTTVLLPCPTGNPLLQVLDSTTTADGQLAVEGLARNASGSDVVIRGFTLRASVDGTEVNAPGTDHDLVVPAQSTVPWRATVPVVAPAGTVVRAALGDWAWSAPEVPTTCPSP